MARTVNSDGMDDRAAPQRERGVRYLLVLGGAVLLGLFGGVLSASGRPELAAIFIGLIIGVLVIASRVAVFWFVLIGGLVVTGVCQLYLPGSRYVRYVVPLASFALILHWVMEYFRTRNRKSDIPVPAPIWWALAFALTGLISVLINLSDPAVAVIGMKDYFQMWPFFLSIVFLRWNQSFAKNLFRGLLVIALVQLPFVVHQYLFLVPLRRGFGQGLGTEIVPVDVVAGTFGALLLGGGNNAVLAAFQVIIVGFLLALWKNGVVSLWKVALLSLLLLSPMLVNEAKVAVLYLPLAFIVVFYRDIAVKPIKFIVAGSAMTGVLAALMTAIILAHPTGDLHSVEDLVNFVVARQTADVSERQGQYSELSRVTALTFWAKEHVTANPANTLLGHGMGASREREGGITTADTLADKRYRGLRIGYTALSALLWDTGIVGMIMVLGMFASTFFTAGRLSQHYRDKDPFKTSLFEGAQASMAVLTLSLAHKDFFITNIPFQTLAYTLIGFIAYSWLRVERGEV